MGMKSFIANLFIINSIRNHTAYTQQAHKHGRINTRTRTDTLSMGRQSINLGAKKNMLQETAQ